MFRKIEVNRGFNILKVFVLSIFFVSIVFSQEVKQNEQKMKMPNVDMHPAMLEKFANIMLDIDNLNQKQQEKITQETQNLTKERILEVRSEFKIKALQIIFDNGLSMHEYKNYTKRFRMDKNFKEKVLKIIDNKSKKK